jgi:hypothetical protein
VTQEKTNFHLQALSTNQKNQTGDRGEQGKMSTDDAKPILGHGQTERETEILKVRDTEDQNLKSGASTQHRTADP